MPELSTEQMTVIVLPSLPQVLNSGDGETLIRQRKCIHCVVAGGYDVLFPVYGVAHWAASHTSGTAHRHVPERLSRLRVERDKVAVPPAPEHHAAGGGEHAALGVIDHLEF